MWVVKLTDKQLEVLRAMLRSEEHLGPALRGALEALELARWDELPDAQLPWQSVADEARRQGVSEAVPVVGGRPALGTWQQLVLIDFDDRPRRRTVVIQVIG